MSNNFPAARLAFAQATLTVRHIFEQYEKKYGYQSGPHARKTFWIAHAEKGLTAKFRGCVPDDKTAEEWYNYMKDMYRTLSNAIHQPTIETIDGRLAVYSDKLTREESCIVQIMSTEIFGPTVVINSFPVDICHHDE